jgi:hypothetical protein
VSIEKNQLFAILREQSFGTFHPQETACSSIKKHPQPRERPDLRQPPNLKSDLNLAQPRPNLDIYFFATN